MESKEKESIIEECRQEWLSFAKNKTFDREAFREGVDWMYAQCGYPPPTIIVVDSPKAAQCAADIVINSKLPLDQLQEEVDRKMDLTRTVEPQAFSPYGSLADYGWVAFYDAMQRVDEDLGEMKETFNKFMKLLRAGHYDFIPLEKVAIVALKPEFIKQENNLNHCTDGPFIQWKDGFKVYSVNNREMPSWIFEEEITKERFLATDNVEHRAGMYARLGQKAMMEMLEAELVDTCYDNDEVLRLWKTKEVFADIGEKMAWVECACPSTGTSYLLGCEPRHSTAKAAMAASWGMEEDEYTVDEHT